MDPRRPVDEALRSPVASAGRSTPFAAIWGWREGRLALAPSFPALYGVREGACMRRGSKIALFLLAFLYCCIVSISVQRVVLPYLVPAWHAGDGLMVGGDWLGYHERAVQLRDEIVETGWSAWHLRSRSEAVSGILAVLYVLIAPEPWVYIPLAAALQASAFLAMCVFLFRLVQSQMLAVVGALPILVFPTALLWITMPLKDAFSLCGFLLQLGSWSLILELIRRRRATIREFGASLGLLAVGLVLVWIARPYLLALFLILGAFTSVVMALRLCYLHWKGRLPWRLGEGIVLVLVVGLTLGSLLPMRLPKDLSNPGTSIVGIDSTESSENQGRSRLYGQWKSSAWIPASVDHLLLMFSEQREASKTSSFDSGSALDSEVTLRSAADMLFYMPRAIQVALFAPFPTMWFEPGKSAAGSLMRRISALEMVFAYLMIPCCVVAGWRWRRRPELLILVLYAGLGLVIQPLFVANVGTLVRLRFPYFMCFVCLGFSSLLLWFSNRRATC